VFFTRGSYAENLQTFVDLHGYQLKSQLKKLNVELSEHPSLRILLINTSELGGGAEESVRNLLQAYRSRGHQSWLAVGSKRSNDPNVLLIPQDSCRNFWAKFWIRAADELERFQDKVRGATRLLNLLRWIGEPSRQRAQAQGHEDFDFPGTWQLPKLYGLPDVFHCYNLHGGYFDLRALTWLSHQRPVILDLRDAWLLSGHCAHSFACERWKTGCGQCPDLRIYPRIRRDATSYNWRRKQSIYAKSRVYVSTPCQWLMRKVEQSMLAPAIVESRIIPTGIDLAIFHPSAREVVRADLRIPQNAKVVLFTANGIRKNMWRDYRTMRDAIGLVAERLRGHMVVFIGLGEIALGETALDERIGKAHLRFIPHQKNPQTVARYYQAADLYVHAARADTFPRAVLEALACGTPVLATAVGGIPEQVKSLTGVNSFTIADATGIIVPMGDVQTVAAGIEKLLTDDLLRRALGENAAKDARQRFDLQKQVDCYLEWYNKLLSDPP